MPAPEFLLLDERKRKALKLLGPGVREISVHAAITSVDRAKHPRTRTYPRNAARIVQAVARASSVWRQCCPLEMNWTLTMLPEAIVVRHCGIDCAAYSPAECETLMMIAEYCVEREPVLSRQIIEIYDCVCLSFSIACVSGTTADELEAICKLVEEAALFSAVGFHNGVYAPADNAEHRIDYMNDQENDHMTSIWSITPTFEIY